MEHEDTIEAATLVLEKIRILQQEYKTHHEGIIDFIDAEDECESEIIIVSTRRIQRQVTLTSEKAYL